ncbi:hypothetical protein [Gluconacetobacter tumulicola]|uniref:Uncharacterized protein n=1 Tax=Gluconacetobacter tumulicola TaxID=1017177 RepID=A0A7W4JED6_9PROT|nr:hypothetical protein [Gluconacetobacter tumulicola]MBB2179738.1 hypothetical protein [Gluconacetobacter tumulicola]
MIIEIETPKTSIPIMSGFHFPEAFPLAFPLREKIGCPDAWIRSRPVALPSGAD